MPVGTLPARAQVGKEIAELAQEAGLRSRKDELETLSKALTATDTKALAPWAELDLVQAYARPESIHAHTGKPDEKPYWRWLEAGLGALVFVPLLFTWFGLTQASGAYESLIEADPQQSDRPFLQLWQTGFEGHLTGWFTFGHVAASATAAIGLLLACAVAHGMRRAAVERAEEQTRRSGEELLARLVPLLVQAQLQLNDQRSASPDRFTGELGKAATLLADLLQQAVKVQESLEKATKQTADAVVVAEKRLKGANAAVRPLAEAADRIETAVHGQAGALNSALEDLRQASKEISEQLERGTLRVEDALSSMNDSQRTFATSTEMASDLSGRMLARLNDTTEQSTGAVAAVGQAFQQLSVQTDALRAAAERFAELEETVRNRVVAPPYPGGGAGSGPYGDGGSYGGAGGTDGRRRGRAARWMRGIGDAVRFSPPAQAPADHTGNGTSAGTGNGTSTAPGTGTAPGPAPGAPR